MNFSFLVRWRIYGSPWFHVFTGLISVVAVGFVTLTILIFYASFQRNCSLRSGLEQARSVADNLQKKEWTLGQFEKAKKETPKIFKTFQKKRFADYLTVDGVQQYFQKWQKKHQVTSLTLKVGNQVCQDAALNLWRMPIVLTLKLLKDSQFYDLLSDIQKNLPGQVILKQFSLKRTASLTPQMLEHIALRTKEVTLFEGKIEFDWTYRKEK